MHEQSCFITLTYDNDHLPSDGSLNPIHYTNFMKALRHHLEPERIRFFHCGEYGAEKARPHYHAIIFGHDFPDKVPFGPPTQNGDRLYRSASLEKLWPKGISSIGQVTWQSAAYCARYIMKKHTGPTAAAHYENMRIKDPAEIYTQGRIVNSETGELPALIPEYITMSNRPGIGTSWFEKYQDDLYPSDFAIIKGKKYTLPRFYDNLRSLTHPAEVEQLKINRTAYAELHSDDNTTARLAVRERCLARRIEQLHRNLPE